MLLREDTIVALSTPAGRSALAVVRLSGRDALDLARRVAVRFSANPSRACVTRLVDPRDGTEIDRGVVTWFAAPASYTGQDIAEISCHGSPAAVAALLEAFVSLGARPAEPGEFTQRALLCGKLDLVQAEALADLIDAPTQAARRIALRQMRGELSGHITALRDSILEVESLLAYDIDFPEEDDGLVSRARVNDAAERVLSRIAEITATFPLGDMLLAGARVVIAGAPNVGKSSLFNALLGEKKAIVTEFPGTTRDSIEAQLELGPWPVRLVDTAGLRETADIVERLGVEVSLEQAGRAHLLLACGDTPESVHATMRQLEGLHQGELLGVLTKADYERADRHEPSLVEVSAHTRRGIPLLLHRMEECLSRSAVGIQPGVPIVTRARHRRALTQAAEEMRLFVDAWVTGGLPPTVAAVHVRTAGHSLDELIGGVDVEDILTRVFSSFCVGK